MTKLMTHFSKDLIFETCFIPFVRRRKRFFGTYSPITSLSCGLTVVAMPKNAILSTVAAAAMLAAAAFFALKSGMVKMEFVGSPPLVELRG